jgi:glycosyltransferase involved in cell wall biosynthesis
MKRIYFNGKFYAGQLNGVHRVADRLIREVDALLLARAPAERPKATLLLPARRSWEPELAAIEKVEERFGHSQAWEQLVLPLRARDGVSVNLCNLAPLLHRPKLLMIHDAQFLFPDSSYPLRQRLGYSWLTPWMARTSARVLTVSDYSRQMLGLFGVSAHAKTAVLHNGADHMLESAVEGAVVERFQLRPGGYVVHVASHKGYKNSQILFDAFADPRLAEVQLAVVGPAAAVLERHGLQPPANAVFLGRVSDAELRGLYERALCLALPSRTEGFGLPTIEAMACGCPAIASPAGAIPEVCGDAVLYAGVDDAEAWVEAIRRYRDDPALRLRKIEEGRERSSAFTWSKAGARLLDHIMAIS